MELEVAEGWAFVNPVWPFMTGQGDYWLGHEQTPGAILLQASTDLHKAQCSPYVVAHETPTPCAAANPAGTAAAPRSARADDDAAAMSPIRPDYDRLCRLHAGFDGFN